MPGEKPSESGRPDYDRLIRFSQLDPGEPFFFIRGRDQVGAAAVRAWAALASRAGAPPAIVESALQQAARLAEWPTKQLPDADHLEPEEAKRLEHQLLRRAWNHRIAHAPNEAILLAEARGAAQAVAQERHADQLLLHLVEALAPFIPANTENSEAAQRLHQALQLVRQDLARRHGRQGDPLIGTEAAE